MTRRVYTLGYTGRTVPEIKKIVDDLGAILVDIRFSPKSRNPQFAKSNLQNTFGQRYLHLQEWGNYNYKNGGDIQIVNFERGRLAIDKLAAPVVIMCACKELSCCHRALIADMLEAKGYTITDL